MMKKLVTILFVLTSLILTSFKPSNSGCLELDLILMGDYSTSIRSKEGFLGNAFHGFVNKFELSEETIKIGVVTFNDVATQISPLTSNKDFLLKKIDSLSYVEGDGYTNMENALYLALNDFTLNGRPNVRRILVIISDGDVNDPGDGSTAPTTTMTIVDQLKMTGIGVCSILIKNSYSKPEFMRNISSKCYLESNYENLATELDKLNVCL